MCRTFILWFFLTFITDVSILSVGSIVSLFESSMYTFVFLWGPVLEQEEPKECLFCVSLESWNEFL